MTRPALHFVGFGRKTPRQYFNALMTWGYPDYYHPGWDLRAARDVAPGDTVVFASGEHDQPPREQSYSDTLECSQLERLSVEHWASVAEEYGVALEQA